MLKNANNIISISQIDKIKAIIYNCLIILAGFPPTTLYGITFFVTTALAPIIAPLPIMTFGIIQAWSPIQTLSSIMTTPFEYNGRDTGGKVNKSLSDLP